MNISFQNIDTDTFKQFNHIGYDKSKYKQCERIEKDNLRLYRTIEGNEYPSVTTVLGNKKDPYLIEWMNKVGKEEAEKITKRATLKGTIIHEMCEKYLLNSLKEEISNYNFMHIDDFKIVKKMLDKKVDNIVACELQMYSDYLKSAGTIDLIAEYEGVLSIIDFKTSSDRKVSGQIHHYFKQVSAYAYMYNEMFNANIDNAVIMMIISGDQPQYFNVKCSDYLPLYKKDRYNFYKELGV